MDVYQINQFNSRQDNRVKPLKPVPWNNFVEFFLDRHQTFEDKNDAPLFNGAVYKDIYEIAPGSDDWGSVNWTGEFRQTTQGKYQAN